MYDMGESLQLITCMTNEVVIFYRNILLHTSDKLNLHSMYLPTCMHCTLSLYVVYVYACQLYHK